MKQRFFFVRGSLKVRVCGLAKGRGVCTLLCFAALVFAAGGCGAQRPIKYYQLTYPVAPPNAAQDAIDTALMVRPFESSPLYLDEKIVYGFDSPEMGTYEYHRWVEPPVEILQMSLIRCLRASGRFKGVYTIRAEAGARFVLGGYLYDFKEVDANTVVARLSYEIRMRDRKSGTAVWSHLYTHDEPVSEKSVNAFVIAMDKNVRQSVQEVQAGLEEYFRAHPPN
jgi:ABC-type uncharacterized transport system auxiliary subunit